VSVLPSSGSGPSQARQSEAEQWAGSDASPEAWSPGFAGENLRGRTGYV
jgi:hypothetical protein